MEITSSLKASLQPEYAHIVDAAVKYAKVCGTIFPLIP